MSLKNVKILVADNDPSARDSLRTLLEGEGYQVVEAASPDEAREALRSGIIHLAILDLRMENDKDPNDESGILVGESTDAIIPRVLLTAHRTKRLMPDRLAGKIQLVSSDGRKFSTYVIDKTDDKRELLLEAIASTLKEEFEIIPKKRIAVLTSGGDSPGMNAAIRAVVRTAMSQNVEVVGIVDGYRGLVEDLTYKLKWNKVSGIQVQRGTILGTARFQEFKDPVVRSKAVENIIRKQVSGLVVIGGDGSMNGAKALAEDLKAQKRDLATVAIPGTIDNDLWGTDLSLGATSAVNAMIKHLTDMMGPAEAIRRIFIAEAMGRYSGYLALAGALGCGADAVIIPEEILVISKPQDKKNPGDWKDRVDLIRTESKLRKKAVEIAKLLEKSFRSGRRYGFVIVAEGIRKVEAELGTKRVKQYLEAEIKKWKGGNQPDVRIQELGYPIRGASPCSFDIWLGSELGSAAVDCLLNGKSEVMVGWKQEEGIVTTPFQVVVEQSRRPPTEMWQKRPEWKKLSEQQKLLAKPPELGL
jgi:6-phosphofructokinase 1